MPHKDLISASDIASKLKSIEIDFLPPTVLSVSLSLPILNQLLVLSYKG